MAAEDPRSAKRRVELPGHMEAAGHAKYHSAVSAKDHARSFHGTIRPLKAPFGRVVALCGMRSSSPLRGLGG
eukprot:4669-Eustigmatos_ZCMA.PRE.1